MTRRSLILISLALAACENDLDGGPGAPLDDTPNGTGTTGVLDDDGSDDVDERLDVGGGATGLTTGDGSAGSEEEGGEGGVGEVTEAGDDGADDEGTTGEPGDTVACLPVFVFAALDEHLHALSQTGDLFTGHTMANEPAGFVLAPGLPMPPGIAIDFAESVTMPCLGEATFPTVCDTGRCLTVQCTGQGASWLTTNWIDPSIPPAPDAWSFEQVLTTVSWTEGDMGVEFGIATIGATPDGRDATMLAYGAIDHEGDVFVAERYPYLSSVGPVELVYSEDEGQFSGTLRVGEWLVADVDAAGHLAPTGECPGPET